MLDLGELILHIRADSTNVDSEVQGIKDKFETVGSSVTKVGDTIASTGTKATAAFTVPIVGAATKASLSFSEVDKTMALTNATMKNTEEQAQLLDSAMKEAAANSTFGMSDAANATLNFARAGLTAEEAAAALAPAMNLAAGEGGNLDTVSAGLTATINGFGDSFDQTAHYADVFASACNNSALDVNSLSGAMSVAAPIFKSAGYNVEDAALYMGIMANNGIEASVAANSLKTGMARLVSPAKDGAAMMEQLGISVTNADGSMKDSITIQRELHDAFAQLSESEQLAAASAIFGKNQMAPWLALINTAPEDVDDLSDSLSNCAGTTDGMAEAMMSGFGGSIEKLKSSIDVLMVSLGELLAGYLQPIIDKVQAVVDKFNSMSDAEKDQVIKIAAVVAAIGPLLIIFGKIVSTAGSVITAVGKIAPLFEAVGTAGTAGGAAASGGLGAIVSAAAPIAAVIAGVVAAIYSIVESFGGVEGAIERVKQVFTNIIDTVKTSIANLGIGEKIEALKGKLSGLLESLGNLRSVWEIVFTVIEKVGSIIATVVVPAFNQLITIIGTVVDIITGLIEIVGGLGDIIVGVFTGDMQKAADGFTRIWEGVKTVFKGVIDGITGLVKGFVDGIVNFFKNLKYQLIGDPIVIDMCNGISEWFGKMVEAVVNFVSGLVESVVNFFTNLKDKAIEIAGNIKDKVCETWNNLKEKVTETVNNLKDKVSETWNNLKDKVTETVSNIKDKVQEKWTALKDKVTELTSNLKDKVSETWNSLKDKIKDVTESLKTAVQEKWTALKDKVSQITDNLKTKVTDAWNNIKSKVSDTVNNLKTTISDKFSSMKQTVTDKMSQIKQSMQDKWNQAVNTIKSTNLASTASNIIGTFKSGLQSAWSSVTSWASNAVSSLKNTISSAVKWVTSKVSGRHRTGLNEVPFDGYVAELHRGERVLTAAEANKYDQYRRGQDNGKPTSYTVNFNGNYQFRDQNDIDYFMSEAGKLIKRKAG